MWFATNNGISSYDGFSFTNYDSKNGIPGRIYRKILVDSEGIIWAISKTTLDTIVYRKDNAWGKILPPSDNSKNNLLNSFDVIYKNEKPVLCLGSDNGFYIYENNSWKHYTISENEALNYVYTVIARNQKFYMATKSGLCVFDGGTTDWSLNKLIEPFGKDIIAINFEHKNSPDDKMWVLCEKWLGYIEKNKFRMFTDKFQLPHPSVYYYSYVDSDKSGNVFFGNIWAKYYISNSNNIPVPLMSDKGFSSNGATSVFIDREQNVWFTDTRGINKINNLKVVNYFRKNGLLEDEVTAIAEMNDGRIVLGHNNGLSVFNDAGFKIVEFPDLKLNTRRVSDMVKDTEGSIWFASLSRGVGRMQPDGNITWYSSVEFPGTNVVHQDRTGRIWVGANTKLLYVENNKLKVFSSDDRFGIIRKIFTSDKGGIFVAGSSGLWHVHAGKVEKVPSSPDKKGDNVFAYCKSRNGIEFVGTNNGLYTIEDGKIVRFRNKDVDITTPIFFIFQDNDDNYWIGSNTGVYKWDGGSKIEVYNIYNGLAGWETNRAAGMIDSKGRIWIGTDRGLTCFEPGYNKAVISIPEIHLLYSEDSKGVKHSLTKKSTISYSDNTLIFTFRGISFINEALIDYRYKLEGSDHSWQNANQAMLANIKYIGLKPGKYTLRVQAKNSSGTWSKTSISETIRIRSPFYLTWWFLLSALVLLSLIIYGIIKINVESSINSGLEKEIIERKRVEQDLTESKQKYKHLIELLPETIYEADFSGKIVYMNDTGFRLFGYQPDDLKIYILINQLVTPESQDEMRLHLESVYEFKKSDRAILSGLTKNGISFPISIHSVPIMSKNKCIGTRGIIMDLTEQKKNEDQLYQNAEDLKALIVSKDKFFSIIAHDLRSPFNSFMGFTEILDEEIDTLPHEELKHIASLMRSSAVNLFQLLENLLEWSLLHRGITKFEPKITLLYPLVENCYDLISNNAKQKEIEVIIRIQESLKVKADIHMLQTITRNLLSNAIKFTPRGGSVEISATIDNEHVVTVAVKDTGIGVPDDKLNKIFLIDTNNKTKGTEGEVSTGLGLILCKEFVEKHGGKIWVESQVGKGSTFYFTLEGATT